MTPRHQQGPARQLRLGMLVVGSGWLTGLAPRCLRSPDCSAKALTAARPQPGAPPEHERAHRRPEIMTEQAERPLKLKDESWWKCVAHSDPSPDRKHGSVENWNPLFRLCCNAFRVWSGRRESNPHCQLGKTSYPPRFHVLQRYRRPQLAAGDPCRPGRVARAWPGSRRSPIGGRPAKALQLQHPNEGGQALQDRG